jgi:hypothetical protein
VARIYDIDGQEESESNKEEDMVDAGARLAESDKGSLDRLDTMLSDTVLRNSLCGRE